MVTLNKLQESLPIILTQRVPVMGENYLASIEMRLRILVEREIVDGCEEVWIYGVNPGGISAGGKTIEDAHNAFTKLLCSTIFDMADEAGSFNALKREVTEFVTSTNAPYEERWLKAVELYRNGKATEPEMPKEPAESAPSIRMTRVRKMTASLNPSQQRSLAAEAA